MEHATHYDAILNSIASRFSNHLPAETKPPPEMYLERMKSELLSFTVNYAQDHPWTLWAKVREQMSSLGNKNRKAQRELRVSERELNFLWEIALHLRYCSHIACINVKTLESISACKIDLSVTVSDLAQLPLPNYIWIEWPSFQKNKYQPWVSRTVGILISRFVVLDAPRHRLVPLLEELSSEEQNYTLELMKALVENTLAHTPCLGYQLQVVQRDDNSYRFIPFMFGHELTEPLVDMLALQKDVSDRDRRKHLQTEQVWSNVAIRLLLFAAHQKWFTDTEHPVFIESSESCCPLPDTTHIIHITEGDGKREICIRPDHNIPFQPFSVVNE